MAHSGGDLMYRQLGSVPPNSPRGLCPDTGMDISGTTATAHIHFRFLSLIPKFWERLFWTAGVGE